MSLAHPQLVSLLPSFSDVVSEHHSFEKSVLYHESQRDELSHFARHFNDCASSHQQDTCFDLTTPRLGTCADNLFQADAYKLQLQIPHHGLLDASKEVVDYERLSEHSVAAEDKKSLSKINSMLYFQQEPLEAALQPIIIRERCPIVDVSVIDEQFEAHMPGQDFMQVLSETDTELSASIEGSCEGGVAAWT